MGSVRVIEYLNGNFKHLKALGYKLGVKGKEIRVIIHDLVSPLAMTK